MHPRLPVDADPGRTDEGSLVHEGRVEPQLGRELGVALQPLDVLGLGLARRQVQIALHPIERAVDLVLADDVVDPDDGRQSRVPHRLRVRAAELVGEIGEPRVGHHGEVRAGVTGVHRRAAPAVDHDDGPPGARQVVGRGEAGNAGADDYHVGLGVSVEPGESGEGGGGGPVGGRVAVGGRHSLRWAGAAGPAATGITAGGDGEHQIPFAGGEVVTGDGTERA